MTNSEAEFIANLRAGPRQHSWRRIAELVHEEYPHLVPAELSGNQLEGEDLCKQAFQLLYGMSMSEAQNLARIVEAWE